MKRWQAVSASLVMLFGLTGFAVAGELDQLRLGDHWYGEKWDVDSMKGHVVVMEVWWYN